MGISILLVGAGGVWLVWYLGYLGITFKQPSQHIAIQTRVCSTATVSRYNDAVSASSYAEYSSKLKDVLNEVEKLSGHDTDPTCLFIQYRYYTLQGQADAARTAVNSLEKYSNEGAYPNPQLVDIESISQMKKRTDTDTTTGTSGESGGAG